MEIRIMMIRDYDKVYKLWSNTQGMGMRSLDDSEEGITKFLKRNPTTNFVAISDKKIIGVILSGHDGRRGYIYHTAVDSDYRGNGVGESLVDKVLESLKEEGINKAGLVVYSNNNMGNRFWEKIGFEKRDDLYYRNKNINIKNY